MTHTYDPEVEEKLRRLCRMGESALHRLSEMTALLKSRAWCSNQSVHCKARLQQRSTQWDRKKAARCAVLFGKQFNKKKQKTNLQLDPISLCVRLHTCHIYVLDQPGFSGSRLLMERNPIITKVMECVSEKSSHKFYK